MASPTTPINIEKKNKAKKRGDKTPFLLAMVGLVVPRSIEKKTKKGSQSSPLYW